ncbi:Protein TIFY 10A [Morella rubra]|uniref:Protein TIFY n=1 Tax=Morella rubra TaxID=262757 RepID=A0A6A1V9Q2_9ROSI|nr:Protein TIFY 10A [Morella rubra]
MSSSLEFSEFGGQRPAKVLEKPSFSQTCSLLSQYLKEKGSFGDLRLGMTCSVEGNGTTEMYRQTAPTMNLFPIKEKFGEVSALHAAAAGNLQPMDLFPQPAGFAASLSKEEVPKTTADSNRANMSSTADSERAQMTIFYGGQVIVFNDFPAEKAKEVMLLAGKGSSQSNTNNQHASAASNLPRNSVDSSSSIANSSSIVPPNFGNKTVHEQVQPPPQPLACELPIARRASLHRFLEKRKDRFTARAPYQTSNPTAALTKPDESKSWLGLAAQSLK